MGRGAALHSAPCYALFRLLYALNRMPQNIGIIRHMLAYMLYNFEYFIDF